MAFSIKFIQSTILYAHQKVCSKAFARRDKLVIHMNKFKHVTPTNIAPLGKRLNHHTTMADVKKKEENNENNKASIGQGVAAAAAAAAMLDASSLNVPHIMNNHLQQAISHHTVVGGVASSIATLNIPQSHQQQLSWSCELCGRMFSTRDEWSLHAKSHLEV